MDRPVVPKSSNASVTGQVSNSVCACNIIAAHSETLVGDILWFGVL